MPRWVNVIGRSLPKARTRICGASARSTHSRQQPIPINSLSAFSCASWDFRCASCSRFSSRTTRRGLPTSNFAREARCRPRSPPIFRIGCGSGFAPCMAKPKRRLYAFDVKAKRLAKLTPRLARSGLSNVHPQVNAHERDVKVKRLAEKIDRVLVDAPCTGFGTLRRNPDLKWRQTPADVAELGAKQARILAAAATLVKPGGRLVYATCSILPDENDAIVDSFVAAHPTFVQKDATVELAKAGIEVDTGPSLRLFPHRNGCDGFFAAILERTK